jgi:gamma-glutamylcyclotransferase (GGCT)/AIG2-like uncharacterized protein YtfP
MPAKTPVLNPTEARETAQLIQDGLLHTIGTADMAFMNQYYWYVPVFLYGTEKQGFSEHRSVMGGRDPVGRGLTVDRYYVMKTYKNEPLVFAEPQNPNAGKVFGEIFMVTPSELAELDNRYMNGSYGRRSSRIVSWWPTSTKDQKNKPVETNRVLCYTAYAPAWEERKIGITPLPCVSSDKDGGYRYYVYTRAEDNNTPRRNV